MTPLVSVIVPTHNRCADLAAALTSLLAQDYPRYEVLAVDNNCSDGTAELVRERARTDARLRYLSEPEPGVGRARNHGCREAQAELLVFFDDDEVAPPGWLGALVRAWQETDGAGVGGPYLPAWQAPPPPWLTRSRCALETLSFFDFGPVRRPVDWLLGGNALYTRAALAQAGYFGTRSSLTGRRGLVGGEDIAIGARMRRAGHTLWWEPAAGVQHTVPRERMRLAYLLRRAFWAGYTDVAIGQSWTLGAKSARALQRGPDAIVLGLAILPGVLYGRLMRYLGYLPVPLIPASE